uniref:non-specific serine/threonine protein kinase n=1 Tax=Cucumis sativus TaxID=3659 RepID=A0A0A0L381_CUCSA
MWKKFTIACKYVSVEALKEIGKSLGKRDWNFSADPCNGSHGWISQPNQIPNNVAGFENNLTCDCTFLNATVCHVISIVLKSQSLQGTLPPHLVRLPFLQQIDLTRNYLSGQIPPEWGSTNLVSMFDSRGDWEYHYSREFVSSDYLFVVYFLISLSGSIPQALGNLPQIQRLHLTSNNFSGELPMSLGKLTTLKEFQIGDNNFSGPIPNFIRNWTNLTKLFIQASGLSGPIPSDIGLLTKLSDLRISDLSASSPFPSLRNLKDMTILVLRSCNISGRLPNYLDRMPSLKILDLSFNSLSGRIPTRFDALKGLDNIFLTGNMLNGSVPDWMLKGNGIDLSYNNFTVSVAGESCRSQKMNLFASSSQEDYGVLSCLAGSSCSKSWYSLHINCGGKEETINGTTVFKGDRNAGSSMFFVTGTNWAISNTGTFLDDDGGSRDEYTATNSSTLSMINPELYMTARVSPLSVTYFGFCMGNGNYTVSLHFAEIMFTDDKTFSSLGRRIFDVYLQKKLVLENFNIVDAAGDVGKAVIKKFPVTVVNGTVEIRFYWAGKGTNAIPVSGVYGPLISAISVDPDFEPPFDGEETGKSGIPVGAVIGIAAAAVFVVLLAVGILWWSICLRHERTLEQGIKMEKNMKIQSQSAAETCLSLTSLAVQSYEGVLADGTTIAVKQLSSKSKQGNREFVNEIGMISALQHPHLVKLYGCCIEGNQLLLVYEYMENNSLAHALFGQEESELELDWSTRQKICVGIARGLAYLHEESRLKIVHRDIKATNILLDKDLNPKISDFGLAKLDEEGNTHISTRIAGTLH